jgi:adenosine deaminase
MVIEDIENLCKRLPKAVSTNNIIMFLCKIFSQELHAHLNGSIRDELIVQLCKEKSAQLPELANFSLATGSRDMKEYELRF